MPSLGVTEIMVILVVALIFIGPKKLPQVSRSIGRAMREFRDQTDSIKREFNEAIDVDAGLSPGDSPKRAGSLPHPPAPGDASSSRRLPGEAHEDETGGEAATEDTAAEDTA